MNSRKVVACDADVLIHLAKLKILSSVTQILKILIPRDIENELIRTTRPHKNQIQIQDEIEKKNIEIIEVGTDQINTIVQQYNMHYGEASVIALAQRKNIKIIFINEKKVRISAKSCNLIPIGTIGV